MATAPTPLPFPVQMDKPHLVVLYKNDSAIFESEHPSFDLAVETRNSLVTALRGVAEDETAAWFGSPLFGIQWEPKSLPTGWYGTKSDTEGGTDYYVLSVLPVESPNE